MKENNLSKVVQEFEEMIEEGPLHTLCAEKYNPCRKYQTILKPEEITEFAEEISEVASKLRKEGNHYNIESDVGLFVSNLIQKSFNAGNNDFLIKNATGFHNLGDRLRGYPKRIQLRAENSNLENALYQAIGVDLYIGEDCTGGTIGLAADYNCTYISANEGLLTSVKGGIKHGGNIFKIVGKDEEGNELLSRYTPYFDLEGTQRYNAAVSYEKNMKEYNEQKKK